MPRPAAAREWPAKPITWVVPFSASGVTDIVARALAKPLGRELGQAVVVENRPGLAGSLGTEWAARQPADGHTLLYLSTGPMAVNPWLYPFLRCEPLVDLLPVHGLLQSSPVFAVSAASGFRTVADFVDEAKRHPGRLAIVSAGVVAGALFAAEAGLKVEQVPYKGAVAALQDLTGGRLHAVFDYVLPLQTHLDAHSVRPLAVMCRRRMTALPEVPTIAEAGWRGAESSSWSGLGVRAGTPEPIVQRLTQAMHKVLSDPEAVSPFLATGEIPLLEMHGGAFFEFVRLEQRRWRAVLRRLGLVADDLPPGAG